MNIEVKRVLRTKEANWGDTRMCIVFKVSGLGDMTWGRKYIERRGLGLSPGAFYNLDLAEKGEIGRSWSKRKKSGDSGPEAGRRGCPKGEGLLKTRCSGVSEGQVTLK